MAKQASAGIAASTAADQRLPTVAIGEPMAFDLRSWTDRTDWLSFAAFASEPEAEAA